LQGLSSSLADSQGLRPGLSCFSPSGFQSLIPAGKNFSPQRREEAVNKLAKHEEDRSQESECVMINPVLE